MARNITDELAAWVAKQEATRRQDTQAVAFLAVRPDVVTALEAGYSMKTVWAFLKDQGRITSSYEAFRRHVQRRIRSDQNQKAMPQPLPPKQEDAKPQKQKAQSNTPEPESVVKTSQVIGKFDFNAKPDKGKLI